MVGYRIKTWRLVILSILLSITAAKAQPTLAHSDSLAARHHLKLAAAGLAVGYTGMLLVLSKTWYGQSTKTNFHFFNDNREWKQLDKVGHLWGAFHGGRLGIAALRAAQIPEKKAIIYGGLLGFVLQSPIEWLDGYATDYGASAGDLGANAGGTLLLIAQQLVWGQVKIMPKFSYQASPYARLRPAVLGSTFPEQVLKDYNGQTYWLSVDMAAFLPESSRYPKWLNLALGYGAQAMVYGEPRHNRQYGYDAYRQYFLALDLNLLHVPTQNRFLRSAFSVISMIHLPAPTVEYNRKKGLIFHPVYF